MSEIPKAVGEGISVSIEEAHVALRGLAAAYAEYARAQGLERAAEIAAERKKLAARYGKGWRKVVEGAVRNAKVAHDTAVTEHMPTLTKEVELTEARFAVEEEGETVEVGFDPTDVETEALRTTIWVRHAIGARVGAEARHRYMNGLYDPEESKKAS